jgi:hypothetical protein
MQPGGFEEDRAVVVRAVVGQVSTPTLTHWNVGVLILATQGEMSRKYQKEECPGAHLKTITTGLNEPLSLTLSPLRGARELAYRRVVVARCAQCPGNFRSS